MAKLRSSCRSAVRICAALVGSAFARRATGERETCWCKRGVSLSGMIAMAVSGGTFASRVWRTVWRNYVPDVAAPCGFVRPCWKVRLRGAVPPGGETCAACRW